LSDGGGIRRNVIVVQKPSAVATLDRTSSVTPVSDVSPESNVTPVDSVTPRSITPVTVAIPVSIASFSPPKVSSAFEQVCHSLIHSKTVDSCYGSSRG